MTEGTPQDSKETASWAVDRIAERMEQSPIPIHPAEGIDGHGFKVSDPDNPEDTRTIGLFPGQNVVTISILDVSIKIRNATASAAKDGIRVDAGDGSVRALFLRDGHVALEIFPAPAPALPESSLSAEDPSDKDLPESASPSIPEASGDGETALHEVSDLPQMTEQIARPVRVKITGRLRCPCQKAWQSTS